MSPVRRFLRHLFGMDRTDVHAHAIKNQMAADVLDFSQRIREVNKYIEDSTAYRVAKAAGRNK